jgi:hypothetical protein
MNMRAPAHLGATWIVASGLGAAIGGALASILFPAAGFAQNPTGQFSWSLVGFAFTVGLVFALFQSASLAALLGQRSSRARSVVVLLWTAVTAVAVAVMIFPLWWTDAELLMMMPIAVPIYMSPGIILLAIGQTLLIQGMAGPVRWFRRTAFGAAIGALIGLPAVMVIGPLLPSFLQVYTTGPGETIWAGTMGLIIGAMQRSPLQSLLLSPERVTPSASARLWAVIKEAASL